MASSAAKIVLLLCITLVVMQSIIVYQMRSQNENPIQPKILRTLSNSMTAPFCSLEKRMQTELKDPSNETAEPMTTRMAKKSNKASSTSTLKARKWKRCQKLISGEEKLKGTVTTTPPDSEISAKYSPNQDCAQVLSNCFSHPPVSEEEKQLPIAYSITLHESARLVERILQAIYMPNNVYCIHIDAKSPNIFLTAIKAMIRCLPNVFVATNRTSVFWGHFSLVQAQFNCMEELLQSPVKWKYYISLVGQDFPLYDNKEIVRALQTLQNHNNINGVPVSKPQGEKFQFRTKFVHRFINNSFARGGKKPPPPHNITIFTGATHIIAIREFVNFVLHSQIGKDFVDFLKDTFIPDESLYGSLHQYPLAPGGIQGKQPEWIPRALRWRWDGKNKCCKGLWVRELCWISFLDLRWALGEEMKMKLFVHKIPLDFRDDLLDCILVARQGRKYGTAVWKTNETLCKDDVKITLRWDFFLVFFFIFLFFLFFCVCVFYTNTKITNCVTH
ncbi:N-acetyllactosaminide beta-1,6-N-acetylglucosaminyl-transferase-like [Montipora foliosa]|uniref:N-acetyllactosaminide beta-1,6-N-acetylglucosaminyl-transferase-like n=1 Tax=Montipora foliosa TaxID=591990 RepID=UPI0035F1DDA1